MPKLNFLQRFFVKTFHIPLERDVVTKIDPDLVRQKEALARQVQTLTQQLSEKDAEERKRKRKEKRSEFEKNIAKKLNAKKLEIDAEELGDYFSFNDFFMAIYGKRNKKTSYGENLIITDKKGKKSWNFGDIRIYEKVGGICVIDSKGKIRAISPNIRQVFYMNGIRNNLIKKSLVLATDENGKYSPDFDDIEIEIPVWNDETMNYDFLEVMKDKAKNIVVKKDMRIKELENYAERLEYSNQGLRRFIMDTLRSKKFYEKISKEYQSDLSKAMEFGLGGQSLLFDQVGRIMQLSKTNSLLDEELKVKEKNINELLDKLEDSGDLTNVEKVKAELFDMIEIVKKNFSVPQAEPIQKQNKGEPSNEQP